MSMNSIVSWTISVQCKHKNKLLDVHLPAIESAIGKPDTGWATWKDEETSGQFKVHTSCNLLASSKDQAAISLLKNAYALFDGYWSFTGLSSLNSERPLYIYGYSHIKSPRHQAPAITHIVLEVEQGSVQHDGKDWVCHYDHDTIEDYEPYPTQLRSPKLD